MSLIKEINKLISEKSETWSLKTEEGYKEIRYDIQTLSENQRINQQDMRIGLIWLAIQNYKLFRLNQELSGQLEKLTEECNRLKKEQEVKKNGKEARTTQKRLPKREPMTRHLYNLLIQSTISPGYTSVRLRVAFCVLAVTGTQINQLLTLRVIQLKTLLKEYWIGIDRSKRGPANYKAFLTPEGKKVVQEREKDFEFLFRMKTTNSYIFTSETNNTKPLSRETLTRDINKVMRSVSENLVNKPNITSHSFRVGYIFQLWEDTKDIEFVRQSISHQKIDSTSSSIKELSDPERQPISVVF